MRQLRFATIGSVDDGKSTLSGRLLYDSKSIFEDQLEHVEAVSKRRGDEYVDLSLLTDGLRAEREQGITIDVAYRYFATPKRSFVLADTPVSFDRFARFFRDGLGARNALYFDGSLSRLYAPALGRSGAGFAIGPMVGLVEGN